MIITQSRVEDIIKRDCLIVFILNEKNDLMRIKVTTGGMETTVLLKNIF